MARGARSAVFSIHDQEVLENLQSLNRFKEKLRDLGHYAMSYEHTDDLLRQLGNQLDRILELR